MRRVNGTCLILMVVLAGVGCRSASTPRATAEASSGLQPSDVEAVDPDRPPPVLPAAAQFLSEYVALELTISAARDGAVQKVVISKPSRAKLYDEYTRNWVEKYWKMPVAKPDEADVRKFIAPMIYPKVAKPSGGQYPRPPYPEAYVRDRVEGLVIVELTVAPSGDVEAAHTVLSSGQKGLDAYTADWVRRKWKFPPGERRLYHCPVAFLIK
jgi:TonB family protein